MPAKRKGNFCNHPRSKQLCTYNITNGRDYSISDHRKAFFRCDVCQHDFEAQIKSVAQGTWCPFCSGRVICGQCDDCRSKAFGMHPKSKFWSVTRNGDTSPWQVLLQSNQRYWFDCINCNHPFQMGINTVARGSWCPICSGRAVCGAESCGHCAPLSFASCKQSAWWSTENGCLKPYHFRKHSEAIAHFRCDVCHHTSQGKICDVVSRKHWCLFCSGSILCGNQECDYCRERSFAGHPKSAFWSSLNHEQPWCVHRFSNKLAWFDCGHCLHTFQGCPNVIARESNPVWCPYCVNQKRCNLTQCHHCFKNSFASDPGSTLWCQELNGDTKPRDKALHSKDKHWFQCVEAGHRWEASVSSIVSGTRCPNCRHKTEQKLEAWLAQRIEVRTQVGFSWTELQTGRRGKFDFCLDKQKILLELDGAQHYRQVGHWDSPDAIQLRDEEKATKALEHGWTVIRLLQEDVFYDRGSWQQVLNRYIACQYTTPTYFTILCSYSLHKRRAATCIRTWFLHHQGWRLIK